jgi:hypothetical protein
MPRDDNGYDPKKNFNPEIQKELLSEEVQDLIESTARKAVQQVLQEKGLLDPYERPPIDPSLPRAYTTEEVTEQLMEGFVNSVRYWQTQPNCGTMEDRVSGVVFSVLAMLDGSQIDLPAFDLMPSPTEEDKEYCISEGENYYDPETVISTSLHELFYSTMRRLYPDTKSSTRVGELTPQQMRESFAEVVNHIAEKRAVLFGSTKEVEEEKRLVAHGVARDVLRLIDGNYDPTIPGFMMFASPSKKFNETQTRLGLPTWGNHIPLNRQAPTYGVTESLVDTYDKVRARSNQAKRDLFK